MSVVRLKNIGEEAVGLLTKGDSIQPGETKSFTPAAAEKLLKRNAAVLERQEDDTALDAPEAEKKEFKKVVDVKTSK